LIGSVWVSAGLAAGFWVVFKANLGEQMARKKDNWGANYNRNGLGAIRAVVFCNLNAASAEYRMRRMVTFSVH
jgi:hypothetical protein